MHALVHGSWCADGPGFGLANRIISHGRTVTLLGRVEEVQWGARGWGLTLGRHHTRDIFNKLGRRDAEVLFC